MSAYDVVAEFERQVAEFAGAPYAVATDCCTSALFLSLKCVAPQRVMLPANTYISVAMAVLHAGATLILAEQQWRGIYELKCELSAFPYPIWDGAKRFRRSMYAGGLHCVSFHAKKLVNIGRGGMILTDDRAVAEWLRRARYDGRQGKPYAQESVSMLGWHCYMTPEQAARGLMLLDILPDNLPDQIEDYPDLRTMPVFRSVVAHATT